MRYCPDVRFSLAAHRIRERGGGCLECVWPDESIDAPEPNGYATSNHIYSGYCAHSPHRGERALHFYANSGMNILGRAGVKLLAEK